MMSTTIFPARYVQGAGALSLLAEEAARLGKCALVILDPVVRDQVMPALAGTAEMTFYPETFGGECCDEEIARVTAAALEHRVSLVVGVGGGKTLDTAKAAAHELQCPVIIVPSLASTDAPCSALSVIYTREGAFKRYLVLPRNPDVVLVDTALIVKAPVRFLVSGMGDALSTWFEAEDCMISKAANMTGRTGGMTAYGLARMCYDTLLAHGVAAMKAARKQEVTPDLEKIVEANTLLSGLGFESGGLSGAHAIHNGLTALAETHHYWHGEKVAIGTLALLMLTERPIQVINEVYAFCEAVGLPTTLAQIGLAKVSDADLMTAAVLSCAEGETIHNAPMKVTPEKVFAALKAADAMGRSRANHQAA
ncbi:MAG TPA: glycerol dehydrogenase [Candidatus Sulfotelmatobacter sp.]|jgi:glycerol dehydrogenase|nr:glycerol dehydrogenase [Candidatus Sulfotelmatobacter sp.]